MGVFPDNFVELMNDDEPQPTTQQSQIVSNYYNYIAVSEPGTPPYHIMMYHVPPHCGET